MTLLVNMFVNLLITSVILKITTRDRKHHITLNTTILVCLRARLLTLHPHLHLHFYIRDANADVGKCPTQPGITQMWMKKFPGDAELPAFP
jgi:hypothetical protein